jgi:hypothetical protein
MLRCRLAGDISTFAAQFLAASPPNPALLPAFLGFAPEK